MNDKIRIGLIDDEQAMLDFLSKLIGMVPEFEVSFSTTDAIKGLEWTKRKKADILITDIIMPELGGLEISKRLIDTGIPVIICSGYQNYGVQGFKVNAVDFLVKPPNPLELSEALEKARKRLDQQYWVKHVLDEDFVVIGDKLSHQKHLVRPSDILYMEQREKESHVFLEQEKKLILVNPFQISLEKLKSPYMVRIHQSFAVNIQKVKSLHSDQCVLVSGFSIPVSRSYKGDIQVLLEKKMIK